MDNLSDRKEKILKAVVDEYLVSASPISSGEIKNKHFDEISSATIRNEMSALEEMGYLIKPHTSAGRVPSKKAYGMYVEKFLKKHSLSRQEMDIIKDSFDQKFESVKDIVKKTAKVITDITNYTSVIVLSNINGVLLKEIKLVGLDEHSALVIIITDSGIIRDKVISVGEKISAQYIYESNVLLNNIFSGKNVSQILKTYDDEMEKQLVAYNEIYASIIKILQQYSKGDDNDFIVDGQAKFLDYPDQDIKSTKEFLSAIDTKDKITNLIEDNNDIEFSVKIGKNENGDGIEKCAIVTAKYKVNGKEIGHAGVIGPERMDYSKVVSVLKYIGKTLDEIVDGGEDKIGQIKKYRKKSKSDKRTTITGNK
ncbi:MAG: heat-inducible transcriptional repressor HrcA [Clostridia bacterium]